MSDLGIVGLTIAAASLATALLAIPGIAIAYALSRYRGALRTVIETMLSLPLVLPPTAVGLLLLQTLRPNGPLGVIGRHIVFSFHGVVVATAVMSFPLLVRSSRTAFEEVDPRLVRVARTLGATRWGAFSRVSLPLARRGIVAGLLLSFSRALGEFGATIIVAGSIEGETRTLALAIFQRSQSGDDAGAMRLVWITVIIAFVAVWTTEIVQRRRR